ncbi:MAG: hypothetical protein CL406_04340 [Acidimicrobiaceae bacterium]|jgi:uncharacterized protein (DUF1015 family)|nr:hypothetical protein [Acidimicrobiaceae bacterium]MDP6481867.1 DUF1015 family protein [Acidimicrobiales bacterium]|tara:strand:- start:1941 stop:3227 length:1287 start_codon:yes stop_codon:yes gene_type:complete
MTLLRPFPGLVIRPEWTDRVTTGPYDAYSSAERAAIAAVNQFSFLHVTRSQEDVAPERRYDIEGLLNGCSAAMQQLYEVDAYVTHDEPALFLYRLEIDRPDEGPGATHVQTGIMGLVPVTEESDPRILRHEAVRPGRTDLLARHLTTVGASSSPVSLTFRGTGDLAAEIARLCQATPELESDDDGIRQTVWSITGRDADNLIELIGDRTLYVTDGHHRLAAAATARSRSADPDGPLGWTQAVLFPDFEMLVLPFHRIVVDQSDRTTSELLEALSAVGSIQPRADADSARPSVPGAIGLYLAGNWYSLTLPEASGRRPADLLDVSRLQDSVLTPLFGIADVASDPNITYVPDPLGLDTLVERCDDRSGIGFVMYPTSVNELMAVADADERMPPKSSYFEPKPRSGVFVRRLAREGYNRSDLLPEGDSGR